MTLTLLNVLTDAFCSILANICCTVGQSSSNPSHNLLHFSIHISLEAMQGKHLISLSHKIQSAWWSSGLTERKHLDEMKIQSIQRDHFVVILYRIIYLLIDWY